MNMHTYKGFDIFPADPNTSGIRWYARNPNGGTFRADTLNGVKELINEFLKGN